MHWGGDLPDCGILAGKVRMPFKEADLPEGFPEEQTVYHRDPEGAN